MKKGTMKERKKKKAIAYRAVTKRVQVYEDCIMFTSTKRCSSCLCQLKYFSVVFPANRDLRRVNIGHTKGDFTKSVAQYSIVQNRETKCS